jgi:hypothetical protein
MRRGDDSSGRLHAQSRDRKTAKKERLKKAWEERDLTGISTKEAILMHLIRKVSQPSKDLLSMKRGITCFEALASYLSSGKPWHGIFNCSVCNKPVTLKK